MKISKAAFPFLCALLCAFLTMTVLAGCTSKQISAVTEKPSRPENSSEPTPTPPPSSENTQTGQPVSEPAPEQSPEHLIPKESGDYQAAELNRYRMIGAQVFGGEEAYPLAEAIYRYRDYRNALIFDQPFEDILATDPEMLVEIAASQAPHVDIYGEAFDKVPATNPVRAFYDRMVAGGRSVSLISLGDDARKTAQALFGDGYQLPRQDGRSIRYHGELDLYYLDAEGAAMTTDYPIIGKITERKDGSVAVSATLVCYWQALGKWSTIDGRWESKEYADIQELKDYLNAYCSQLPTYEYILKKTGDSYRVTGFQPL